MLNFFVAVAAGVLVYFVIQTVAASRTWSKMTELERRNAEVAEQYAAERRLSPRQRIDEQIFKYGGPRPVAVQLLVVLFVYTLGAATLNSFGISSIFAYVGLIVAALVFLKQRAANKRVKRARDIHRQLVAMFLQLAGKLEAGSAFPQAMRATIAGMEEPLRSEMSSVRDRSQARGGDMKPFEELADKYPSQAMRLFASALRVTDKRSGKLAPALRRAAELVGQDMALVAETRADIAGSRKAMRVYLVGVPALCMFVAFVLADGNGEAFLNPVGLVALTGCCLNYVWGVLRYQKLMRTVEGDL